MKKTLTLALILALVMVAFPVAAQTSTSLVIGLSNKDTSSLEVLGELSFGMSSSINLRGKYAGDWWAIGAGWREYVGDDHNGAFIGPFVMYDNKEGTGYTDLGAEIGYRYIQGRFIVEGSGRIVVTTQEQTLNLMAGIRF